MQILKNENQELLDFTFSLQGIINYRKGARNIY